MKPVNFKVLFTGFGTSISEVLVKTLIKKLDTFSSVFKPPENVMLKKFVKSARSKKTGPWKGNS